MARKLLPIGFSLLYFIFTFTKCATQEDSLQSALNAVNRRQRDLSDYPAYSYNYGELYPESLSRYSYSPEDRDEISFLRQGNNFKSKYKSAYKHLLLDLLEDGAGNDAFSTDRIGADHKQEKRISSSFRERLEEDRERQRDELADLLINKLEDERDSNNNDENEEEYDVLVGDLWEKYKNTYPELYDVPKVYSKMDNKKRSFYPSLGWDSIGMRKRKRFYDSNQQSSGSRYLFNYIPREELLNRMLQGDDDNEELSDYYIQRERKFGTPHYLYPLLKRLPLKKRSSNYQLSEYTHQHKRSPKKELTTKTDPKVEKDLSNIFGASKTKSNDHKKVASKKTEKKITEVKKAENNTTETKGKNTTKDIITKEVATTTTAEEPLMVRKKSIDWSDYFGLDRRKKFDDELDNEWLMDRYHKALAMATKRSAEYPLQNFRNHDNEQTLTLDKKDNLNNQESKIQQMDEKLKNIEDSIVDEALKYTGAHEGTSDSKEIQEVKDQLISRLAAAYSLEKMRRALGEYKLSVAKELNRLKEAGKTDEYMLPEEKRVSVARKQAIDKNHEKIQDTSDNNIRCTQSGEDCHEQNYRVPDSILESTDVQKDDCPKIHSVCKDAGENIGHHGDLLEPACHLHQICLLCGENTWFSPTRQCNVLYLSKAYELCDENVDCQKEAQRSVRYLLDVNRSLRTEPLENCDFICPDNKRR